MNMRPSIYTLALLVSGCASNPLTGLATSGTQADSLATEAAVVAALPVTVPPTPQTQVAVGVENVAEQPAAKSRARIFPGTDQVVKANLTPKGDPSLIGGEKVSLNFENVPLGSLAHALLGDVLQLNYTIDAGADTVLSLRTRQPLERSQILDVLDSVLLPHDLAIFRDAAGVYHVTKRSVTVGARPVVGSSRFKDLAGSGTVIAQLNYIGAAEMAKILSPIATKDAIVYVDTLRNLIVLQGSKAQLGGWLELVEAFDVDFLSGMSLGVFALEYANVNEVRDAMQAMLGSDKPADGAGTAAGAGSAAVAASATGVNPLAGLIRIFPVERLNSLVVVTPRQHLLAQVETWVRRLDRPADGLEAGLFVYLVQNGSAIQLADLLNGLFGADANRTGAGVAAGTAPSQLTRSSTGVSASGASTGLNSSVKTSNSSGVGTVGTGLGSTGSGGQGNAANTNVVTTVNKLEGNVRVVADEKRNALLIRASRQEYRRIEQALRELDKAPSQVLIEASIVEVSLTGNLKYGVEWFVQNGLSNDRVGNALLNMNSSGGLAAAQPGFSYTILNKAGVIKATLNALAEKSQVRVLSSPSIMVLNNHNATIQIGKQQPIKSSTTVTGTSVSESITYKDTGVLLSVTPSVNAGGMITMDISQQVTDVGEIDAATGQRNFLNRQIQSRVAVRSGEPIVLGGLIRENETRGNSGVPGLADIPLLGALFSTTSDNKERTELLVLLTPRALDDDDSLRAAGTELRERMRTLSLQPPPTVGGGASKPSLMQR